MAIDVAYEPGSLAVDANNVYWSGGQNAPSPEQALTGIHAVPIGGGPSIKLVPDATSAGLAVRAGRLYFKNSDVADSPLARVPTDGGAVEYLSSASGPLYGTPHVDDNYAYLVTDRIPLDGGPPQQLVDGGSGGGYVQAEALDSQNLYWTTGSQLLSVPVVGGSVKVIASNLNQAWQLAIDGTDAYWTTYGNSGAVQKTALSGGGAVYTLADQLADPYSIVADDTSVYVSVPGAQSIIKIPKAGGPATVLISNMQAQGMAVDATSLYWAYGNIYKLTPK